MVRASLGSKAKLSVPKAPEIKGTAVEESYPMYAIPVKDFLQLKKWRPHQVWWRRERGLGMGGAGAAPAARTFRSLLPENSSQTQSLAKTRPSSPTAGSSRWMTRGRRIR